MSTLAKSILASAVIAASATATTAHAEYQWGFANISVNQLDWSSRTSNETGNKDFYYLEVEGGAGFDWGEVYGFYDIENPQHSRDNKDGKEMRIATKGTVRYYLGDSGFNLYGQVYHFNSKGFYETNSVLGFGYNYANDAGFWFKPFLGLHYVDSDNGYTGKNGMMAGWVAGYDFKAFDQSFAVTNWHETEFNRNSDYLRNEHGNSKRLGQNGAVALWWNATDHITTGIQYRYANDKLGSATYKNAMIYTVKYNF